MLNDFYKHFYRYLKIAVKRHRDNFKDLRSSTTVDSIARLINNLNIPSSNISLYQNGKLISMKNFKTNGMCHYFNYLLPALMELPFKQSVIEINRVEQFDAKVNEFVLTLERSLKTNIYYTYSVFSFKAHYETLDFFHVVTTCGDVKVKSNDYERIGEVIIILPNTKYEITSSNDEDTVHTLRINNPSEDIVNCSVQSTLNFLAMSPDFRSYASTKTRKAPRLQDEIKIFESVFEEKLKEQLHLRELAVAKKKKVITPSTTSMDSSLWLTYSSKIKEVLQMNVTHANSLFTYVSDDYTNSFRIHTKYHTCKINSLEFNILKTLFMSNETSLNSIFFESNILDKDLYYALIALTHTGLIYLEPSDSVSRQDS